MKSSSLNLKAASIKEMIWIEAAFYVDKEMETKIKEYELGMSADIRVLLKDLDDVQRIKAAGKKDAVIDWKDLPSFQKSSKNEDVEQNAEVRKAFLKELSKRYN